MKIKIPPTGPEKLNLEVSQKLICMAKVRNLAEITPNIGFTEFDFYDLYRSTFEKSVEFGAKVNNILVDGISFIEKLSFNAFNEGTRLVHCLKMHDCSGLKRRRLEEIQAMPEQRTGTTARQMGYRRRS